MAFKYVAKAARWSSGLEADVMDSHITVLEAERSYFTGLYDHRGHEIHSVTESVPMGFHKDG